MAADSDMIQRQRVAELVQNWAIWRDAGDWERFRSCWHEDGFMMATWCQAPAAQFIAASQAGWAKGVSILHFLGGVSVDVAGTRAIAQTKMTISQRAEVQGVMVDVVCTGRFYDFVEERAGQWGIVMRQPIYEKDRMDPVDPAEHLVVDVQVDLVRQNGQGPVVGVQEAHHLLRVEHQVDQAALPVDPVAVAVDPLPDRVVGVVPRGHLVVRVVSHLVAVNQSEPSAKNSTTWRHRPWVVFVCLGATAMLFACPVERA
jgi:hypothetical protein